jgi:hypothetical protein
MRILALALLVTAAAACESAEEPKPAAVVLDEDRPCAVATPEEVAAVTGGEPGAVRAGEGHSKDGTVLCTYEVGPPFSSVTVYVDTDVSADAFRERMERDPLNIDPLDGAGDLAFTRAGVEVSVWEDGAAVSASVQHFDDPDSTREAIEGLAELIDSKL